MRAARKCSPTRGKRSTVFSKRPLRRLLGNLLQNPLKQQIPLISTVVPEGVFVQVGLQILRADAVIDAADSTLHKTPESFNRLGVNISRNIDSLAMPDAAMDVALRFQSVVSRKIIGEHGARWKDIFLRQTVKSLLGRIRRHASHYAANTSIGATFDHANDRNLVRAFRRPSASSDSLSLSAVVHLIHLNRRALQLQTVLGQETPNLAEHAPRCFVGDASLPLNLLCGDTATGRAHEIHCVKPSLKRSSGLLEYGPCQWIDVIPAMVASVGCTASNAVMLAFDAALRALSNTIRPALLFDVFKARIIVRELAVKVRDRTAQLFRNALLRLHGKYSLAGALLVVKG